MRRPLRDREKHKVEPDYVYSSENVAQFINYLMRDGKKSTAERLVYDAFDIVKKKTGKDPLEVFEEALSNVGPSLEVRSRRVGGANYQVPYEVRPERKLALGMGWIRGAITGKKGGRSAAELLADELVAAANHEGEAVKKRELAHSMADANKAFAHFAFVGGKKKK